MVQPTTIVEFTPTLDPGTAPSGGDWVAITSYCRLAGCKRGRSNENDRFSPGEAHFTIDNSDRRFDPENTAGPYYPNVKPMRRIRFRCTVNAVTYDLFYGFVERWPQTWPHPTNDAVVPLVAVDGFYALEHSRLPSSPWVYEVGVDNPTAWWRCGDGSGSSTLVDATANRFDLTYQNAPSLGNAGLVAQDSTTSATFDHTGRQFATLTGHTTGPITGYPFSVEAWVQVASASGEYKVLFSQASDAQHRIDVAIPDTGNAPGGVADRVALRIRSTNGSGVGSWFYSTATVADGNIHHIAVTASSVTSGKVYVDGVDVTATSTDATATLTVDGNIGLGNTPDIAYGSFGLNGTLQDVVVYNGVALSALRILLHYNAGKAGAAGAYGGQASGSRMTQLHDIAGWPTADRNFDAGQSTMQPTPLGGSTLAAIQTVERSEQGAYFIQKDGKARWRARQTVLTSSVHTTSQATFGDANDGVELPYVDVGEFSFGVDRVVNEVRGNRRGGTSHTVKDTTSQTTYFDQVDESTLADLEINSDLEIVDAVNWRLSHYKDPAVRPQRIAIKPSTNTQWASILSLELGYRVTLKRRPPGGGAVISKDCLVEAIEHDNQLADWTVYLDLSLAETQQYWVLGTSQLGTDTRVGY